MRGKIRLIERRIRELKREAVDDEPPEIITVRPAQTELSREDLGPNERIVEDYLRTGEGQTREYRRRERVTTDETDHGRFLDAGSGAQIGAVGEDGDWLDLDGQPLHSAPVLVFIEPEGVEELRGEVRRRGQGPSSGSSPAAAPRP